MKILNELRDAKGFDTWTCLTYGTDLAWFALEVKLLKPNANLSTVEEEMAADITGYSERWSIWFVLYDCGVIRDPARMKGVYQQTWGVTVTIVKH